METWAWLAVYVVAFGLLQLALFRYVQRDEPSPEATPSATDRHGPSRVDGGADGYRDGTGVRCAHCGAVNERHATIAFCRSCVRPLG